MVEILEQIPFNGFPPEAVFALVTSEAEGFVEGDVLICRKLEYGASPQPGRVFLAQRGVSVVIRSERSGGDPLAEIVAYIRAA